MTFGGGFGRVFRPAFDPGLTALPWYRAGGAPLPVAAYQPKGASSLAASYVNLANPGTYDAAPGVAPTLDASGWVFDGSARLNSGVIPDNNQTWSAVVRYSSFSLAADYQTIFGINTGGATPAVFAITLGRSADNNVYYENGSYVPKPISPAAATLAIAANLAYRNGIDEGVTVSPVVGAWTEGVQIGCVLNIASSLYARFFVGNIQALAIYNTTLTAPQIAAVSAAMAAL